jgi:hypothetical protein
VPAAIAWKKIYIVDTAGYSTVDIPLKTIHPDALLNDYTFFVRYIYLNHDGGSYNVGFRQELLCVTVAGSLGNLQYPADSTERFGASSGSITCSESVVSDQLRITIAIDISGPSTGRLFVEVLGTSDPTP